MEIFNKIEQYIPDFEKKLNEVNSTTISSNLYCQKYLAHLLLYKRYYLHIYASVLEHALKNTDQAKEEIILIDYGAGNGLLGLFAKFCGFKRVFINDHNKVFCEAAERLSIAIDVSPDNIIVGDIDAVAQFFLTEEQPTAIVGTDVIEHIYDLSHFVKIINKINSSIISVFTTASNPFNKYKVHQLKQLQYKDEYIGNSPEADPLFGEAGMEAFIKIREDIIRKNFTVFEADEITKLAIVTRGLIKKDIIAAVQKYLNDKSLPALHISGNNTCDPYTGSWTERILTYKEYQQIYLNGGYQLSLYNGFYNEYTAGVKGALLKIANAGVSLIGKSVAPFIGLVGTPLNSKS